MANPRLLASLCLAAATTMAAADNAAQQRYGATIAITCSLPKPYNDQWAKPADLLREEKPGGPIVSDLASARYSLAFPVRLHINQVVLGVGDYKGGWARPKEVAVEVGGAVAGTVSFPAEGDQPVACAVSAESDRIAFVVKSVYPPRSGPEVKFGGFNQIRVMVDEDLGKLMAPPAAFPDDLPQYLMPTANLGSRRAWPVLGKPRTAAGHPCTIWDAEDIAALKRQIAEVPAAKDAWQRCLAGCEKLVTERVKVPDEPDYAEKPELGRAHTRVAEAIANLGMAYALSGDERFAAEAKSLLLQLADRYEAWPVHSNPKMKHDASKWSWQRLNDAIWLVQAAWGFDLIQGSKAVSAEERAKIADHFVMPCVKQIMSSQAIIAAPTNWSVICCTAVMVGARACDNQEFWDKAVNGLPVKNAKPDEHKGGIYFFIDKAIDDDGLWGEGAIGYQFMAMRGLVVMAETLWHNGIDVWGYHDSRLKLVFDSPLWFCYPGGTSSPALGDSGSASLFGRDAHLYQYAARRYGDRTYDAILSRIAPPLASVYNLFMPACDFRSVEAVGLPPVPSIRFPGVGYATARCGDGDASTYLLVEHGPNGSHHHPDKLAFNLYGLGEELFADAGIAWYTTDIYQHYYNHTLAHNTIAANGQRQIPTDGRLEAFCQAGDLALIRATCGGAIPGAGLDRTLVQFGGRVYDIYRYGSAAPMAIDLPYHSHGSIAPDPALAGVLAPWTDPEAKAEGYSYFEDARIAAWEADWSCAWTVKGGTMRLRAIGEPGTRLVVAQTPKGGEKLGTVMLRRSTKATVFAGVCDLIPNGGKDSVTALRKLEGEGGAYALVAALADGGEETVLVNPGAGAIRIGPWSTDSRVAALRTRGGAVEALILGGGRTLTGPGCDLALSAPALVTCYAAGDGLARFTNHGGTAIEATWAGIAYTTAASVGRDGAWSAKTAIAGGRFAIAADAAVDLARGEQPTVASREAAQRLAKQQAAAAAAAQRQREREALIAAQQAAAAKEPAPADALVVVQAEDFTGQGGGEATATTTKTAAMGPSLTGWNNNGHWIEFTCVIAKPGWYQIALKYCAEGDGASRVLRLDGQAADPNLPELALPGTGGWSNGADNWSLMPIAWPGTATPYLFHLAAGKHVLRFENPAGGGLNLDYLVIAPAAAQPTRAGIER